MTNSWETAILSEREREVTYSSTMAGSYRCQVLPIVRASFGFSLVPILAMLMVLPDLSPSLKMEALPHCPHRPHILSCSAAGGITSSRALALAMLICRPPIARMLMDVESVRVMVMSSSLVALRSLYMVPCMA